MARLTDRDNCYEWGCSCSKKSKCQVCVSIDNCDSSHSHVTKKEYNINCVFNCDLSNVVYLFDCVVCGFQFVGSTSTPFRYRFNNYRVCYCKFSSGSSVSHMDLFRQFSEENHHGFLEDICVKIIDRLVGGNRLHESFWQYKLDTFMPWGLNVRQVEP